MTKIGWFGGGADRFEVRDLSAALIAYDCTNFQGSHQRTGGQAGRSGFDNIVVGNLTINVMATPGNHFVTIGDSSRLVDTNSFPALVSNGNCVTQNKL